MLIFFVIKKNFVCVVVKQHETTMHKCFHTKNIFLAYKFLKKFEKINIFYRMLFVEQ